MHCEVSISNFIVQVGGSRQFYSILVSYLYIIICIANNSVAVVFLHHCRFTVNNNSNPSGRTRKRVIVVVQAVFPQKLCPQQTGLRGSNRTHPTIYIAFFFPFPFYIYPRLPFAVIRATPNKYYWRVLCIIS